MLQIIFRDTLRGSDIATEKAKTIDKAEPTTGSIWNNT
jgi:hypothetical protein